MKKADTKERLLAIYDECLKLGATKEQLAPLSAFIWISDQPNYSHNQAFKFAEKHGLKVEFEL